MTLTEICEQELEYMNSAPEAVVFVKDSDGDHFYLYTNESKRVAIQSLNNQINPIVYGLINYKVVGKTDKKFVRMVFIDRFKKECGII